jgi:hypothetical protein
MTFKLKKISFFRPFHCNKQAKKAAATTRKNNISIGQQCERFDRKCFFHQQNLAVFLPMSTSKARFQSNSVSTGASKPPPGAKSSVNNGKFIIHCSENFLSSFSSISLANLASKRAGGNATTMNNATAASSGKTGPVQVIFNGKIVTPQSLVPKKPHHSRSHHDNYVNKKGKPLANPQTIDETVSETTEKMPLHSMPSKAPLRK